MPIRTTPEAVQDILAPGGDYTPGKDLRPFIRWANHKVNWIQAHAADYDLSPNDADVAIELEGWLAAYAYKLSDQQVASSTAGRSSASLRGTTVGRGLELNNYGVGALELDQSGLLAAINKGMIVGASWLGKPIADQLTWSERNWGSE